MIPLTIGSNALRYVFIAAILVTTTLDLTAAYAQSILKLNMVSQTIRERSVLVEGNIAIIFGTSELRFANAGKEDAVQTLRYTNAAARSALEARATLP